MKELLGFCSQLNMLKGWEPVALIGSGSNGKVYHICHTESGRNAALKWIHIEQNAANSLSRFSFEEAQAMLLQEIVTLRKLDNVKEIVAIQESQSQISLDGKSMDTFIRMELLDPLLSRLNAHTVTVGQTERLVRDIARALDACHAEKIIHGDIKPENILCGEDGFKLGDFGVALDILRDQGRVLQGTQYFQPPEYHEGAAPSVVGDVYSFGMTLYVMFNNGMIPFQKELGRQAEQKAWQQCCDHARDPNAILPPPEYATKEIGAVIVRAMSGDPANRYQSVHELADAYCAAAAGLSSTQKALCLPYNVTETEISQEEKIYLSTGRDTYGHNPTPASTPAPKAEIKEETAADWGFAKPEKTETKDKEKEKESTVSSKPAQKKSRLPVIIICAVLVFLLGGVGLFFGLVPEPIEYATVPGTFGTEITLTNVEATETVRVITRISGAEKGTEATVAGNVIVLDPLAPDTSYEVEVTIGNRSATIPVKTAAMKSSTFQPVRQRIYTCKSQLLEERSITQLEEMNLLEEIENQTITLRNKPLAEQNTAILVSCLAKISQLEHPQETEMHVVLRVDGKAVLVQQKSIAPVTLSDTYFRSVENINSLLDAYYAMYGTLPEGTVQVEIYWLDELVGETELKIEVVS